MATYYKGKLFLNSELNENTISLGYYQGCSFDCDDLYKKEYNRLNSKDRGAFIDYLNNNCYREFREVNDKKVINVLEQLFADIRFGSDCMHHFDIIFEKFVDVNGIEYGKELHTNLIFPLSQRNDFVKRVYEIESEYISYSKYNYKMKIIENYNLPTLSLCEAVILENGVANQNEVLEYQNRFNEGFGRKKKESILKMLFAHGITKTFILERLFHILKNQKRK